MKGFMKKRTSIPFGDKACHRRNRATILDTRSGSWSFSQTLRTHCRVSQICVVAMSIFLAYATHATDKVLILDPTVSGGANSLEAQVATSLGFQVEVVDEAGWRAKSQADFATYRALILGDPHCQSSSPSPLQAAADTTGTWGPVVNGNNGGNIVVIGTDDEFHSIAQPGSRAILFNGIAFATGQPNKTGLYVSLSCYYGSSVDPPVPVDVLNLFGTFTAETAGCSDRVHIVAPSHPVMNGLSDGQLSGWNCSIHEVLPAWPADFQVIAIDIDLGNAYTAPDGTTGTPYIVARGTCPQCQHAPVITRQPQSTAVCFGDRATFQVGVAGECSLSFRWQKDGVDLQNGGNVSGADTSTLTLSIVGASDAGSYRVRVTNPCGTVTSATATLTIVTDPPQNVSIQPQNLSLCPGELARFTATSDGSQPLSYQWQHNGVNLVDTSRISGSTTATLTITGINPSDLGNYSVVVQNPCGSALSSTANLS